MDTLKSLALPVATWGTGLVAGLFVAFSVAVMPGLARTDDRTFVMAMQKVNVAIVNPAFLLLFLGTPVLLVVAVVAGPERRWAALGLGLTVVALLVTFAVNIPLNDRLAAAGSSDPAGARAAFEHSWNVAHTIRTLLMSGSLLACILAVRAG